MSIKNTISITEARKRIFDITDKVAKTSSYFTLTEKGRPKAVIMSAEEFESWMETLDVMREIPDLEDDIKEVKRDLKSGAYKKYSTMEEVLAEAGYVVADKPKKKYDVSSKPKTKGRKRAKKSS